MPVNYNYAFPTEGGYPLAPLPSSQPQCHESSFQWGDFGENVAATGFMAVLFFLQKNRTAIKTGKLLNIYKFLVVFCLIAMIRCWGRRDAPPDQDIDLEKGVQPSTAEAPASEGAPNVIKGLQSPKSTRPPTPPPPFDEEPPKRPTLSLIHI